MKKILLLSLLFLLGVSAHAQFGPRRAPDAPFNLKTESWTGRWISVPNTGPQDYGVYYFRKKIQLERVPASYIVHVTGDNRYKFYVNGTIVSLGPARSDAVHWNYETVDLAPYLNPGDNMLAALVIHEGPSKPEANISVSAGFLLQGQDAAQALFTDDTWKCVKDTSYSPLRVSVPGYYVSGPGEKIDMASHIRGWKELSFDDSQWVAARAGQAGQPINMIGNSLASGHNLQPSPLPQMELKPEPFLPGLNNEVIPAHSQKEFIVDNKVLTNAFFTMVFSGGKGAHIRVGYTEAFYNKPEEGADPRRMSSNKGNRNEIEGKVFRGREDEILPDGTDNQIFSTLNWRTYRYVMIQVKTGDTPLTINKIQGTFIGYPFEMNASLKTENTELQQMLEIGWRTARLCALETYMDCPFYEQLQYLGDTRIQALISLYNSGDDRLVKNFLKQSDMSRNADGITMGRYPTSSSQYITPYALSYVYALRDYMYYGQDTDFVLDLLGGAEQIIHYFSKFQQEDGRIVDLPGWNFSDWVYTPSWNFGAPLKGADGCSILMDLQLLYAFQTMADMEGVRGNTYLQAQYSAEAEKLKQAIVKHYWSAERGLFSDRSEKDNFSQHANAFAILCDIPDAETSKEIADKLLSDTTLSPCSVYYKFYLHQALVKAGLGNDYLDWLDVWRENIAMGMTTWGETSDVDGTRSDCHAWGASPNIEFFRTLLGIDSDGVAFKKVRIQPHLGTITQIGGEMPHPDGKIAVQYNVNKKGELHASISLPDGIDGTFVYGGKEINLHQGLNNIDVK